MWTLFILLTLWCLRLTVCASLPSPVNVSFSSVNLRNVLHWLPEHGTPEDTHFTVEYAIYGDTIEGSKGRRVHWRPTRHCTDITRTWCDLSNETWDEEHSYYARVRAVFGRASSKWALTRRRFDPKTDTAFGPPLVSVEIENNSAIITLNGPMRYSPSNHTQRVSMAAVYPQMTYNLSIHNTGRNHMQHFPGVTSPYKYGLMEYNTEYCFSAQSKFFYMPVQCQSSAWYCITTPQDPVIKQLQRVVVGIVVPSLFLCVIVLAGYLLYNYLSGKDQKTPFILSPPSFHSSPLMLPPENYNIVLISVLTDEPPVDTSSPISDPACPLDRVNIPDPPPRYFPQRSETPLQHEEPSDEESIDYAFISLAPKATVGGREEVSDNLRCDGGDGGNNLKCEGRKEERCRIVYAPKAKSRSEMGGHGQGYASALVTHTQAFFQSLQGHRINGINENRKLPDLFVGNNFQVPPNIQTKSEEEMDGRVRVRTDRDEEEGGEPEKAPLLSGYASQNISNMPTSPHPGQSDVLPEDYGVVMQKAEGDDEDDEEEEEGAVCIDWDPESRKLVLPVKMVFTKDRGVDGVQGEEEAGGGEGEACLKKGELMFENVFVRQASEEEAQGQLEDMVTKWNLVISMNQ
ncbi:interleukin-20 receptor subunit alpha [Parambassis ranga]|uniref:Interleukin-20 receptor subunit alpha n=1 Tax=Parambassis ranga TaxID=210632 RepID=A0A6P7HME3_9TELE|nr:interleukin-20 receptor subunit alpha-like [Parambassis ranga]